MLSKGLAPRIRSCVGLITDLSYDEPIAVRADAAKASGRAAALGALAKFLAEGARQGRQYSLAALGLFPGNHTKS